MSENLNPDPDAGQGAVETELCPQCMEGNRPGSNFCVKCGAPLSSYAATGPFESLFAEGHLYRTAAERPQRLVVVLGMWLIFGAFGLTGLMLVVSSWTVGDRFGFVGGIALLAFSAVVLRRATVNYRNRARPNGDDPGEPRV